MKRDTRSPRRSFRGIRPVRGLFLFFVMTGVTAAVLLIPLSCATLPGREVETAVYDRQAVIGLRESFLSLGKINIQYADELADFSYPLTDILKPLAGRYGFTLTAAEENEGLREEGYSLDVWIKEENFAKGLDFRTSITGTFFLREKRTDRRVFSLSYAEESEETIQSFRHLYHIFDVLFARMAHESEKKPAKS